MLFDAETALTCRVVSSDFVSKLFFLQNMRATCILRVDGWVVADCFIYVILP